MFSSLNVLMKQTHTHIKYFTCFFNKNIYIKKQKPHVGDYVVLPCGALLE